MATIGYSFQDVVELERSNVTDWTYAKSKDSKGYLTASGQFRYKFEKNMIMGLGYHTRRGIIGGIGYSF